MTLTFFKNISSDKFSILSQYDNLSLYTYEQMKLILVSWQHRFTGNDIYFDAEWNDGSTRIKIRYQTSSGAFIQISSIVVSFINGAIAPKVTSRSNSMQER